MPDTGWHLAGASVRVIHIATLADDSGLTIAVSSEAGKVRLNFDSEYRYLVCGLSRQPWHTEATREPPVEILAAVTSANIIASDDELEDTPLPWEVRHKAGRPVTVYASVDTPPGVIAALALTSAS